MDLKKSALALLALGLTGVASAGGFMPAPACSNHPVTVPCERSAWDVGFTAYWARPTTDHLYTSNANLTSFGSTSVIFDQVKPKYKFGFGLEGSYHWGTGNDLTVNWTRFHKTYTHDVTATNTFTRSSARFNFDAVNLELGQQIDVGPNWDVRVHMGGQYMRLDHTFTVNSAASAAALSAGNFSRNSLESDFDGFGPRTGLDARYGMSNGFGLVAHSAVALLVGDQKTRATSATFTSNVSSTPVVVDAGSRRVVVAGLENRTGLSYTHNMSQGNLVGEVGYAVSVYHNPIWAAHYGNNGGYAMLKYVS